MCASSQKALPAKSLLIKKVPEKLHTELKVRSLLARMSLRDYVVQLLEKAVEQDPEPASRRNKKHVEP
jgi:predicted HicB family RNase H-like nuclease